MVDFLFVNILMAPTSKDMQPSAEQLRGGRAGIKSAQSKARLGSAALQQPLITSQTPFADAPSGRGSKHNTEVGLQSTDTINVERPSKKVSTSSKRHISFVERILPQPVNGVPNDVMMAAEEAARSIKRSSIDLKCIITDVRRRRLGAISFNKESLVKKLQTVRRSITNTQELKDFDLFWFSPDDPNRNILNEEVEQRIADVGKQCDQASVAMQSLDSMHFGNELLKLFFVDYVGGNSAAAKIFQTSLIFSGFETSRVVRWSLKVAAIFFLVLSNLCFVFFSMLYGRSQGKAWQEAWVTSCAVTLLVKICFTHVTQTIGIHFSIPQTIASDVKEARAALMLVVDDLFVQLAEERERGAKEKGETKKLFKAGDNEVEFSAADYLFVSSRLAKHRMKSFESALILSYRCLVPPHMPNASRDQVSLCARAWRSSPRSSSGDIVASVVLLQAIGCLPISLQRMCIQMLEVVILGPFVLAYSTGGRISLMVVAALMMTVAMWRFLSRRRHQLSVVAPKGPMAPSVPPIGVMEDSLVGEVDASRCRHRNKAKANTTNHKVRFKLEPISEAQNIMVNEKNGVNKPIDAPVVARSLAAGLESAESLHSSVVDDDDCEEAPEEGLTIAELRELQRDCAMTELLLMQAEVQYFKYPLPGEIDDDGDDDDTISVYRSPYYKSFREFVAIRPEDLTEGIIEARALSLLPRDRAMLERRALVERGALERRVEPSSPELSADLYADSLEGSMSTSGPDERSDSNCSGSGSSSSSGSDRSHSDPISENDSDSDSDDSNESDEDPDD